MTRLRPRHLAAGVGVTALAALAAGCGVEVDGADRAQPDSVLATSPQAQQAARDRSAAVRRARLPRRPSGQVVVDGDTRGSLTAQVTPSVRSSRVTLANRGAQAAFRDLCRGRIDAVDSARPILPSEWRRCRANGLEVVQFQVAADATVVATKNESDVGVDCLTLAQVRDLFRAGSPIDNWNQVHGFDLPLRTTGPTQRGNGFDFFTRFALNADRPSPAAYRSDYRSLSTDQRVRMRVVGSGRRAAITRENARARGDVAELRRAISAKERAVRAARSNVSQSRRDGWSASEKAAARRRLDSERRALRRLQADLRRATDYRDRTAEEDRRLERSERGWVGYFRFSYYELFEEQLRPIEIDAGTAERPNCVFPSQQTVTDATFPLARQLLITVTLPGLRRDEVRGFLLEYLRRAQGLASRNRLVPLPDDRIRQQREVVQGERAPQVVFYPDRQPASRRTTPRRTTTSPAPDRTGSRSAPAPVPVTPSQPATPPDGGTPASGQTAPSDQPAPSGQAAPSDGTSGGTGTTSQTTPRPTATPYGTQPDQEPVTPTP